MSLSPVALVRQLVELHGGSVSAHSDGPDQGTTFAVNLPLRNRASAHGSVLSLPSGDLAGRQVLLVDDSEEILTPFSELLELEGAAVTAVTSGEQALERLAASDYDILLSDLGMPGMDGLELIRRVRELDVARDITAIALTGFGRPQDERTALQAGFDAHLSKPVSMSALLALLGLVARRTKSLRPER